MVLNFCPALVGEPPFLALGIACIVLTVIMPHLVSMGMEENKERFHYMNSISFTWRFTLNRYLVGIFILFDIMYIMNGCLEAFSLPFFVAIFYAILMWLIMFINGDNTQTIWHSSNDPVTNVKQSYKVHSALAFTAFFSLTIIDIFLLIDENAYGQYEQTLVFPWLAFGIACVFLLELVVRLGSGKYYKNLHTEAEGDAWDSLCSYNERIFAIIIISIVAACPKDPRQ